MVLLYTPNTNTKTADLYAFSRFSTQNATLDSLVASKIIAQHPYIVDEETSVPDPDPDPPDPHIFGPPGSGSGSGSGSFYHPAKIVRKTLIPTIL
jgi:hypothetical protein